jgi:long-chain acyl-CoA synthetase
VKRHTTGPEMLFPGTTASTAARVTIGPANEAVVNGADVSNLALDLTATARRIPDNPAADTAELKAFTKQRVAAYKYPRRVWLVESLPTGPTGTLLRREVTPPSEEV